MKYPAVNWRGISNQVCFYLIAAELRGIEPQAIKKSFSHHISILSFVKDKKGVDAQKKIKEHIEYTEGLYSGFFYLS